MMSSIQGRKWATLVYNPGRPGRAQPITIPESKMVHIEFYILEESTGVVHFHTYSA